MFTAEPSDRIIFSRLNITIWYKYYITLNMQYFFHWQRFSSGSA